MIRICKCPLPHYGAPCPVDDSRPYVDAVRAELAGMCLVVSKAGANGEPLACGWVVHGPEREHAWASLPTYPGQYDGEAHAAHGALVAPAEGTVGWTPDELLKLATQAATRALDRAHADGVKMPWASQAAGAIAVLDTVAKMLAAQGDTPS